MDTYRVDRTYDWNYEHGPRLDFPTPVVPETPLKEFFGYPVGSRLGVAAGLLLNSRWIAAYAELGFDILTYKTVRIKHRPCQPPPNWIYLDHEGPLDPSAIDAVLTRRSTRPVDAASVTSSVSFGMPSRDPRIWMADVSRARDALRRHQVLVVSVVASPDETADADLMVSEFGELAARAADSGAQVVEANLSCPNVPTAEGSVYLDDGLSGRIARAMRERVGDLPVTLKVGHFRSRSTLGRFLGAVDGAATGVVLVNGISRRIVNLDGTPAFGPGREVAGILGRGILKPCLANVRDARRVIERDGLQLQLVAVGGVLGPSDAARYFDEGVAAVMLGGGPMFDPLLAVKMKTSHPEW